MSGVTPRTGVLFVHGIGESAQSATLREFSAPIVSWLADWFADRKASGSVTITDARLSYGNDLGTDPAHFLLKIDAPKPEDRREILFAEGWWATHLAPPSALTVIAWSGRVLWRVCVQLANAAAWRRVSVWEHVAGGGEHPNKPGQRLEAAGGIVVEYLSQLLLAIAYLLGAVAGYAVLVPLAVLVQIPVPAVQDFIFLKVMTPLLVNYLGDFEVYTHDAVQALNVRAAVECAADWLADNGCSSICVIAHSHGAVVAFDAVAAQGTRGTRLVRKLVTMGGALNRAWNMEVPPPRLDRDMPASVRWLDVWSSYDPVPGGRLTRKTTQVAGVVNVQVTNNMNVLSDHGGYFHNREEVIARLAAEIDAPGDPAGTRFTFTSLEQDLRVRRRWARVVTLVFWRLVAMALFALVAIRRGPFLISDGRSIWTWLENLPGVAGIREGAGNVVDGISTVLSSIADATAAVAPVQKLFVILSVLLSPGSLEPLFKGVVALGALALTFGAVYVAITWALYDPWVRADARHSVSPALPRYGIAHGVFTWTRAFVVPTALFLLALQMRVTPTP